MLEKLFEFEWLLKRIVKWEQDSGRLNIVSSIYLYISDFYRFLFILLFNQQYLLYGYFITSTNLNVKKILSFYTINWSSICPLLDGYTVCRLVNSNDNWREWWWSEHYTHFADSKWYVASCDTKRLRKMQQNLFVCIFVMKLLCL